MNEKAKQIIEQFIHNAEQINSDLKILLAAIKELDPVKKYVVAVDFDGTLAYTNYPEIISPIMKNINLVKEIQANDNFVTILYTCRHGQELMDAVDWCREMGIVFDYVNENVPWLIEKYGDCRKISADFVIDDNILKFDEHVAKFCKLLY